MKDHELKHAMETIVLSPELYDRILEKRKPRPHQGLKVSLVFVLLIFAIGCGSIVWMARYRVEYQQYSVDLAKSVAYACETDGLKATVDGEELRISEENAHKICSYILFAKAGWPESTPPEGECVRLEFGNGATLQLWEAEASGAQERTYLWYTYADGKTYGYSAVKIDLDSLRGFLRAKDNKPWNA